MAKEDFIARLVKARSALGWSQADLAKASGISATQLSRYESGLNEPRINMIGKLAKSLNVQLDWLAHGRGPIDGDNGGRPMSPGLVSMPLDFSAEEMELIQGYAASKGLSVEMATRQLALSALKGRTEAIKLQPESASEAEKEAVEHIKQALADLEKRLASLEGDKTPSSTFRK